MGSYTYEVVVYGGGLPGIFAAAKAASELGITKDVKKVALIVPYPKTNGQMLLGGTMTTGGLNYWDDKSFNGSLVQKGSYLAFKNHLGHGFNILDLHSYAANSMKNNEVEVYYNQDISSFEHKSSPYRISSVTISAIDRNSSGNIVWTSPSVSNTLTGTIFIDASEEGRLARMANSACTVGRFDWPTGYLDTPLESNNYTGRQQAATLMIKMKNIDPIGKVVETDGENYTPHGTTQALALWVGRETFCNDPDITYFNSHTAGPAGFLLKGVNAARNGKGSDEWWVNAFLIFNVDGRANYRDIGTSFYPTMLSGHRNTDEAWIAAREFLRDHLSTLRTLFRKYHGFEQADFVMNGSYPVVGDILYLRETVHMAMQSGTEYRHNNSESNYHIRSGETKSAGSGPPPSPSYDKDYGNYPTRIGLGLYGCDLHPYVLNDVKISDSQYCWALDSAKRIRSDAVAPPNPVYVPYETLTTRYVANLLLPGYAANIGSYPWGEMRVFSNLSVLGDAAGIAAGYCCNKGIQPFSICDNGNMTHIKAIQTKLLAKNARLEK